MVWHDIFCYAWGLLEILFFSLLVLFCNVLFLNTLITLSGVEEVNLNLTEIIENMFLTTVIFLYNIAKTTARLLFVIFRTSKHRRRVREVLWPEPLLIIIKKASRTQVPPEYHQAGKKHKTTYLITVIRFSFFQIIFSNFL